MTQTINRMYDSLGRANQAAAELRTNRFVRFADVYVTTSTGGVGPDGAAGAAALPAEGIVAALMKAYVLKAHAKVFAEGIQRGGTLVTVHAPFGTAVDAITILESFGPVDSGVPDDRDPPVPWDEAAPCSSTLGLRVLLPDSATFSRFWNLPVLSRRGGTTCSWLGVRELSDSSKPFTGTFGMALLTNQPTWLSSKLGLPVLTSGAARR